MQPVSRERRKNDVTFYESVVSSNKLSPFGDAHPFPENVYLSVDEAFDFPGVVPAYIRPLFCKGAGPFRWAALSGNPSDIYETDKAILELFPQKEALHRWIHKAREQSQVQGRPARICGRGQGARARQWRSQ